MNKLTLILTPTLILAAAGVLGAQTVTVNPTSLSFSALVGVSVQSGQLAVSTSNGGPVIADSNSSWLKVDASSSVSTSTPATLNITADPTGLSANTYTGTIALNAIGTSGFGPTVNVPVTFAVGTIGVSQTSLSLLVPGGRHGPGPAERDADLGPDHGVHGVSSAPTGCTWLTVPTSGTAPGTLALTPNASALPAAGTYACTVTITPTNAPAVPITATLTVTPAPTVTATPSPVSLAYQIGGATGATNAASQTLDPGEPGLAGAELLTFRRSFPADRTGFR